LSNRRRASLLGALVLFSGSDFFAQIDTPPVPVEHDLGDLFLRISSSEAVVVGTVISVSGVPKKLSEAEIRRRTASEPGSARITVSLDDVIGGTLAEVRVDEVVCRQEDFFPSAASSLLKPGDIAFLFTPREEPTWQDGRRKEFVLQSNTYLLFFVPVDEPTRTRWRTLFQLAPTEGFYRPHQRSRGVVPLVPPDRGTDARSEAPVLDRVARLCRAARAGSIALKIAQLEQLAASGDPLLGREARLAIASLRAGLPPRQGGTSLGRSTGLSSQTAAVETSLPSVRSFYEAIARSPSEVPADKVVMDVTQQIPAASHSEVVAALPSILRAFNHENEAVKLAAAAGLIAVALRPDSASLLAAHVDLLAGGLASNNKRLRSTTLFVLGTMNPSPTGEVINLLIAYVGQPDGDPELQAGAIFPLARHAPENPDSLAAIRLFLGRPLALRTKIGALNGLGTSAVKDPHLIAMVTAALDDPEEQARFTAAQVLGRMGPLAVLQAEPNLRRIAGDGAQSEQVRMAAREALKTLEPSRP
jgi:hypothetical protein